MNFKDLAKPTLRIGIALVFLWFGVSQIVNPAHFQGYLPQFLFSLSFAQTLVIINGVIEVVLGLLLIAGIAVRIVAAILALHLLFITVELGFSETGVRDFGLTIATIAIALGGEDKWCLSTKLKKNRK